MTSSPRVPSASASSTVLWSMPNRSARLRSVAARSARSAASREARRRLLPPRRRASRPRAGRRPSGARPPARPGRAAPPRPVRSSDQAGSRPATMVGRAARPTGVELPQDRRPGAVPADGEGQRARAVGRRWTSRSWPSHASGKRLTSRSADGSVSSTRNRRLSTRKRAEAKASVPATASSAGTASSTSWSTAEGCVPAMRSRQSAAASGWPARSSSTAAGELGRPEPRGQVARAVPAGQAVRRLRHRPGEVVEVAGRGATVLLGERPGGEGEEHDRRGGRVAAVAEAAVEALVLDDVGEGRGGGVAVAPEPEGEADPRGVGERPGAIVADEQAGPGGVERRGEGRRPGAASRTPASRWVRQPRATSSAPGTSVEVGRHGRPRLRAVPTTRSRAVWASGNTAATAAAPSTAPVGAGAAPEVSTDRTAASVTRGHSAPGHVRTRRPGARRPSGPASRRSRPPPPGASSNRPMPTASGDRFSTSTTTTSTPPAWRAPGPVHELAAGHAHRGLDHRRAAGAVLGHGRPGCGGRRPARPTGRRRPTSQSRDHRPAWPRDRRGRR